MAIIEWQEHKETFNPDKNYFDVTIVDVSRETSKEEDRLSHNREKCFNWGGSLAVISVLGALFGGITLGALELWLAFCIVFPACIIGLILSLTVILGRVDKYTEAIDRYIKENDVWNTPEVKAIKQYNKEQQEIADKWRAEHPFEEQIRQCLLDPKSSVDIAKAAIIYVENYFDKENYS